MTKSAVLELIPKDKLEEIFNNEGVKLNEIVSEKDGTRITLFGKNSSEKLVIFLENKEYFFFGCNAPTEPVRIKASKIIFEIKEYLTSTDFFAFPKLLGEQWYKYGAKVIPNMEKYKYLTNTKNYKNIKKHIKETMDSLPVKQYGQQFHYQFKVYGVERLQLIRALKALKVLREEGVHEFNNDEAVVQLEYMNNVEGLIDSFSEMGYVIRRN